MEAAGYCGCVSCGFSKPLQQVSMQSPVKIVERRVKLGEQVNGQRSRLLKRLELKSVDRLMRMTILKGSMESFSEGNGDKRRRPKMKEKEKATIKDEFRSMGLTTVYARSAGDLLGTDLTVQPVTDNLKMDVCLIENLSQGNANKEKKESLGRNGEKKVTVKDEIESMVPITMHTRVIENVHETDLTVQPLADNLKMGADPVEHLSEGNANMKKKKRRKRNKKKKVAIKDDVQNMDQTPMDTRSTNRPGTDSAMQPLPDSPKTDAGSTENLSEGNVNKKKKKRPKRNKKKATIMDGVQSMYQTTMDIRSQENLLGTDLITMDAMSKENLLETDLIMQPQADNLKTDAGTTENLSEGNVNKNKKKRLRRKNKKKATTMNEVQSLDQTTMETMSKENLLETDLIVQPLPDNLKAEAGSTENPADGDEIQTMDLTTVFTGSTENLAERNVISKRRRKKKSNKAQTIGVLQSADQAKMGTGLIENLANGNVTSRRKRKRKSKKAKNKCTDDMNSSSVSFPNLTDKPLYLYKHEETVLLPYMVEGSCYKASSGLAQERFGPLAWPMELEGKRVPCESQHRAHPSLMTEVDSETILYEGKGSAEGRSSFSACNLEVSKHFSSNDVQHADCLYTKMTPSISIRRKLLVLDVNGLLADIVQPPPKHCRGDMHIFGRAIFTRPFCDEFMKFCFQNFDVGIWSSRSRKILNNVVNYLLGDLKHKLLFCWDRVLCTQTGFKTLENKHKPLVCKELRKIWDNNDPNLPWKQGDYNESNTLLLDDSPYKALLNPLHTAIFPHSYTYMDENDNSLGPGGNLRVYLEGLAASENVQTYVEQHPFGQSNIDEKSFSWGFYAGVLNSLEEKKTHPSTRKLIR